MNKFLFLIAFLIVPFIGFSQSDSTSFQVKYMDKKEVVERQNITSDSIIIDSNRNTLVIFYQENSSSNTDVGQNDFSDLKIAIEGCNMINVYIVNHNLREELCPMFYGANRAYTNTNFFFKPAVTNDDAYNGAAMLRKIKNGLLTEVSGGFFHFDTKKVLINCLRPKLHKYLLFVDEIKEVSNCTQEQMKEEKVLLESKQAHNDTLLALQRIVKAKEDSIVALNEALLDMTINASKLKRNEEENKKEIEKLTAKIKKISAKKNKSTSVKKGEVKNEPVPKSVVVMPSICFDKEINASDSLRFIWFQEANDEEKPFFEYEILPTNTGKYILYFIDWNDKYKIDFYGKKADTDKNYKLIGVKTAFDLEVVPMDYYTKIELSFKELLDYTTHKIIVKQRGVEDLLKQYSIRLKFTSTENKK